MRSRSARTSLCRPPASWTHWLPRVWTSCVSTRSGSLGVTRCSISSSERPTVTTLLPGCRTRHEPWEIEALLRLGVQVVTVPHVRSAEEARSVVASVFHPPKGQREPSVPPGLPGLDGDEYRRWASEDVLVGCQIEDEAGIEHYLEIVRVEGIDIIHTGRNDLAEALGVPGEQFHPTVLEMERRIVEAALEAGKQVSLFYPLTVQGFELAQQWIAKGVSIFALDIDHRALSATYTAAVSAVRGLSAGLP